MSTGLDVRSWKTSIADDVTFSGLDCLGLTGPKHNPTNVVLELIVRRVWQRSPETQFAIGVYNQSDRNEQKP